MTLVLDAGAFIGVERNVRHVVALLKRERDAGRVPVTHGGVVGQVWRGGKGRQANIARLLASTAITPLDEELGRRAGRLLHLTRGRDVIDAALVLLAHDGDEIVTSAPDDLVALAAASGTDLEIIPI